MNKYTEAIQGDDVVILCDGIPMGVGEILAALNAATPPADASLTDGINEFLTRVQNYATEDAVREFPMTAIAHINGLIGIIRKQAARLRALSQPAKLGFREHLALHATDDRKRLRELVDVVWNEATDSETVPSTITADELIDRVMSQPEVAQVPAGIWMREFVDAVEREAFKMLAPNTHTPVLVGMCIEARRRLLSAAPSAKGGE